MKTNSPCPIATRSHLSLALRVWLYALLTILGLTTALKVEAASQTWSTAPADTQWTNVLNWAGGAVPGVVNNAVNNAVNNDLATFNSPIFSGRGGAANPIIIDDGTVVGAKGRMLGGILFDTTNCGAYVFYSPSSQATTSDGGLETGLLNLCHNGGITNNINVTNVEKFLVPIGIRLPSSTDGIFNLVNLATNPAATLYLTNLFLNGATTRGVTYVLDGSNTGTNTIAYLSQSPVVSTGVSGVRKQGSGTWILSGPNNFRTSSPININDGTLIVRDPGAFSLATNAVVNSNAVLQIEGVSLSTVTLTLQLNGRVKMNGSATVNGLIIGSATGTSPTLLTSSSTDVLTIGDNVNKVTGGAATSVLHLAGPGTVLLDQANNYVGKWSLDTGTNQLTDGGALGQAANYNLTAGAVLDLTSLGATTYQFTPKSLNANGTGTVAAAASMIVADPGATVDLQSRAINLNFTPTTFSGDTGHAALYLARGTLSCNGNAITANNASATPLGVGTYQLVHQATGSILSSGAFITQVIGSGLAAGTVGEIVASGGDLNLVVTTYTPKPLVWIGNDPILPGVWDRLGSTNWLAGATPSTFNIYDTVTFDATGSAAPTVNLAATMQPGFVTVDTTANDYTFTTTSGGQIAGGAGLLKKGTGTLFVNVANTYSGGTLITNGAIKIGIDNALPSTGSGDVTNLSPAIIDVSGFADTIGALNGSGTVDVTGGGTSTLTIGNNDNSGTFSGLLENSAGTLNITKTGFGTETLTRSNSYVGTTDIELGTLKVTDPNGIGNGVSPLVINGGTLDLATNINVFSLAGSGGTIANVSTTTTNTLTVQGLSTTSTSYGGSIGGGKIALRLMSGTLRLTAANTYSNGTYVAGGATFQIHNSPAAVTGPLIASNTATVGLSGGSSTPGTPTSITTVDGAAVTFTSGAEGEIWTGQFLGSATATNIYTGPQSAGGSNSFASFLGLVKIALTSGNFRFFNGGGLSGGDNTTFEFDSGNVHTRDAQSVTLGTVVGGSSACGIGGPTTAGAITTWIIGAKNVNCAFEGYISGSNNLVKAGTGTLTLDGAAVTTNTDGLTYSNYAYASVINYVNNTTVSNGVLAVSVPNDLTASPNIILATTNAVLDARNMGYVSNFIDVNGANSVLVTNGTLTIVAGTAATTTSSGGNPQVLSGIGAVRSTGVTNNGTINPGLTGAAGTLVISNASLVVNAGATNYFDLSDDPSGVTKPSDRLVVQGNIILSGSSVLGLGALNGNVQPGTYTLIKYSGSLINEGGVVPSGPIANLALGGVLPAASRATFAINNAPGEIDLTVVSINNTNLTWTGDGLSNIWDIATSSTFTNFVNPMQFYQMDNVTFDDTANPTNDNVYLSGVLAPGTIIVNSITNYLFGGNGSIEGPAILVKKGSGTLILTNGANSYTGGTVLSNGVLNVGMDSGNNQNDLALGTGPVSVNTTNAELRFGGNGGSVVNHFVTNTIVVNGGTVKAQDGVQHLTNSSVAIGAAGGTLTTVFATKNLVLDSPLSGTGPVTVAAVQAGTNAAGGQVILTHGTNLFSGAVAVLTNANLAFVGWAGLSNSASFDIQQGAILDISARSNSSWSVQSGQTLKGNGTIRGRFITAAAGSTVAPGIAGAIGTLTVTNGVATPLSVVTLAGTTSMDINRGVTPNADRIVNANGTNALGGTLTVNNLGAAPVLNDSFQLFVAATNTGAFTTTNLPALGSGLAWSNSLAVNGRITVVSAVIVPTIPPGITNFSLVGGNVVISGTNGQAGGTYYLLMTTNLTYPRAQWRTVATNILGGNNYTFTGTNAVTANAGQQFYMLSSTNSNP